MDSSPAPRSFPRRAFSTLGCPHLTLEDAMLLAHRHGIEAIELRALEGTLDLPALFHHRYGSPAGLARRLESLPPVRIESLDTSFHLVGSGAPEREQLLGFLPWATAMGARRLRVFDGRKPFDRDGLAAAQATLRWWQETVPTAPAPVELMIETHDALCKREQVERLLEVAPAARILWDAHNMWRAGAEDPCEVLRAIRAHVVHVHVKDSISRPSEKHPYTFVLPGQGEFPMRSILSELALGGFRGCVSLEWETFWHPGLPPLEEALSSARTTGWW